MDNATAPASASAGASLSEPDANGSKGRTPPELSSSLAAYVARYRLRLMLRISGLTLLTTSLAFTVWWRWLREAGPQRMVLALSAAAVLALVLIGVWAKRLWLSASAAASKLDASLRLQQRLVTAYELAGSSHHSVLYGRLVDETSRRIAGMRPSPPAAVDRLMIGLSLVLLALWLWPAGARAPLASHPGSAPQQAPGQQAQRSDAAQQSQDGQGSQPQQQPQGGGLSSGGQQQGSPAPGAQPQSGQSHPQPPSSGGSASPQTAPSGDQRASGAARQPSPTQGAAAQAPQSADAGQPTGDASQAGQQGQGGRQGQSKAQDSRSQAGRETGGDERQSGQQTQAGSKETPAAQQAGDQRQAGQLAQQDGETGQEQQPGQQPGSQPLAGQQAGGSDDQAVRAEIQQLLKNLSQDLQQLQQQLQEGESPADRGGIGTNPELYGGEPPPAAGQPVAPLSLETDEARTQTSRRGSGTGAPSGEIGHEAPQAIERDVSLHEAPTDEAGATRTPIPPAYEPVFDRLRNGAGEATTTTRQESP